MKKTSKVLIVHEDKVFSGFGAEIAGIVGTEMFRYLDAPIQRVGSTFTPVGFHPVLEKATCPEKNGSTTQQKHYWNINEEGMSKSPWGCVKYRIHGTQTTLTSAD